MNEFKIWAPAEALAAAVEARQPGTLKFLEDYMQNGREWLASQSRLGAYHDWTLEETVDHVLDNVWQWASRFVKPQVD